MVSLRAAVSAELSEVLSAHLVAPNNVSVASKLYDFGATFSEKGYVTKLNWFKLTV